MKLCVVRHGEAQSAEVDPARPLTSGGKRGVERVAHLLEESGVRFGDVRHSGKERAKQTAELLAAKLASVTTPKTMAGLGPNDPVDPVVDELACREEDILIVGHLPHVQKLASRLLTGDENSELFAFGPATACCLVREGEGWRIAWVVRPEVAPP